MDVFQAMQRSTHASARLECLRWDCRAFWHGCDLYGYAIYDVMTEREIRRCENLPVERFLHDLTFLDMLSEHWVPEIFKDEDREPFEPLLECALSYSGNYRRWGMSLWGVRQRLRSRR